MGGGQGRRAYLGSAELDDFVIAARRVDLQGGPASGLANRTEGYGTSTIALETCCRHHITTSPRPQAPYANGVCHTGALCIRLGLGGGGQRITSPGTIVTENQSYPIVGNSPIPQNRFLGYHSSRSAKPAKPLAGSRAPPPPSLGPVVSKHSCCRGRQRSHPLKHVCRGEGGGDLHRVDSGLDFAEGKDGGDLAHAGTDEPNGLGRPTRHQILDRPP